MSNHRTIAHFDLDAFFVSVECIHNPALKGLPLIVGGTRQRGVVAACSYEARKYGVHSAMPMATALRLCPQATVVKGAREEYSKYSRRVTEIIADQAPRFEKASIDEFYLDLSGMEKYFNPMQWTMQLRSQIMEKTGLPISFGLATSKLVAKIATNLAKPNGYLRVEPGREKEFLAPLKVNAIPGVGKQTHQLLLSLGIQTIGDISHRKAEDMEFLMGKQGAELWYKSQGIHHEEVIQFSETKSLSTETTFDTDSDQLDFIISELIRMTEALAYDLRGDNKTAGCIAIKIRYADFETRTRQMAIPYTCYEDDLIPAMKALLSKAYQKNKPVRLLGVRLSELTSGYLQTSLFEQTPKKTALYQAVDSLKKKFGIDSITRARNLQSGH